MQKVCESCRSRQISKNAEKCVFGRKNRRRYSRERASERVLGRGQRVPRVDVADLEADLERARAAEQAPLLVHSSCVVQAAKSTIRMS